MSKVAKKTFAQNVTRSTFATAQSFSYLVHNSFAGNEKGKLEISFKILKRRALDSSGCLEKVGRPVTINSREEQSGRTPSPSRA